MLTGAGGLPDPATIDHVRRRRGRIPVDLEIGPGGDLFYVDFDGGTIRRIHYSAATSRRPRSRPPTPTNGAAAAAWSASTAIRLERPGGHDR